MKVKVREQSTQLDITFHTLGKVSKKNIFVSGVFVNIKTKVAFQYMLLILKLNFCFDVNNT